MSLLNFVTKKCEAFTVGQAQGKSGDKMIFNPGYVKTPSDGTSSYEIYQVPMIISGNWKVVYRNGQEITYGRGNLGGGISELSVEKSSSSRIRHCSPVSIECIDDGEYRCIMNINPENPLERTFCLMDQSEKMMIPELAIKQYIYVADGLLEVQGNQILPEQVVIVNPQKEFEVTALEKSMIAVVWYG